ncbi:hypothetical protein IAR55_006870 [Kwoniella newhampshirensis]|uniref:Nitrogen regulatory protein areA GATA-like domain-containing protein n=1 Tax=Kwoniella newhampshirensis TaxID=1651941 RepID=A0AAW0YDL6_9TREE
MAQIIPSITSLPSDSGAAPSVEDIQDRLPSICVDYLSHDWSEKDIWASWRNMTRHKHEIANGVRLENASWRTWQKQRNKLKTISPETLNWLKDSDVTWLYGPLHTADVEPVRPLKIASTDERLGIDRPNPSNIKKPILKHRTLSEMLTIPMPSSPILEASNNNDDDDDSMDGERERPILLQTKSDTNIIRNRTMARQKSPPRGPFPSSGNASGKETPADPAAAVPLTSPVSSEAQHSGKKHISFNTFVEQCVAVDSPQDVAPLEDSDDEMLEMKSSSLSSSSRSSRPSMSRNSSSGSADHLTIAKIAPTMLKTMNTPGGSTLQMVYQPPPEYQSPGLNTSSSFDFPSPQVDRHTGQWGHEEDEDEYGSVGYDYFGGPDLIADEDNKAAAAVPAHVGTSYGKPPTVNQPPAQPKWRQAAPSPGVEPSSISSSSSSSSSLNVTSPQPSRSILKVRSPGPVAPPEPSSPPLAYFNYNPSAATGIGGMRGSNGNVDLPGPTGSPIASPVVVEERGRGRTPSRDRGGLNDRSTSRGTSASSSTSISSTSSRSPVESNSNSTTPRKIQTPPGLDKVQEGITWEPGPNQQPSQDYVPERSSTPTPHSSPQITFRPLKDTSPASLPHTSTVTRTSDLPKADPPTTLSPTSSGSTTGAKATIAHVGTNAQPTLSQPVDDDDGASIMGRAANIASTAKDLLGALWYGANEGQPNNGSQGPRSAGGAGSSQQAKSGHRRTTSGSGSLGR